MPRPRNLLYEQFIQHVGGKKCKCLVCFKELSSRYCAKRHIKNVHVKPDGVSCTFCNETFNYPVSLRRHYVKYHGEGVVVCPNATCRIMYTDIIR